MSFWVVAISGLVLMSAKQTGFGQINDPQSKARLQPADSLYRSYVQDYEDSIHHVQDSLEITMLGAAQTYQQIERLLSCLPPHSLFLDSLPAVLPIDVPIERFHISSRFGFRLHPIHKSRRFHAGVDVKAPEGMLVKATAPGRVIQVGYNPDLGAFVRLRHAFGFETVYGHLKGYCVKPGQQIVINQELGRVGQSGLATGFHLHYSIKKNGSTVDPFYFCFLLRRRLWLNYELRSKTKGVSISPVSVNLSSRVE